MRVPSRARAPGRDQRWVQGTHLSGRSRGRECVRGPCPSRAPRHNTVMLNIDLSGRRALVAGVADDGGFGFAIAKALAEAGASVCVGTWPPALNIFLNLLERGKMDESLTLSNGKKFAFEKIYPLDAAYDTLESVPDDVRSNKRYKDTGD